MKQILFVSFGLIATAVLGCHSGRSERPSPEAKRAMDSAMTAVRDSGRADSTARDTSRR
jgi:hypothetical protein